MVLVLVNVTVAARLGAGDLTNPITLDTVVATANPAEVVLILPYILAMVGVKASPEVVLRAHATALPIVTATDKPGEVVITYPLTLVIVAPTARPTEVVMVRGNVLTIVTAAVRLDAVVRVHFAVLDTLTDLSLIHI